MSETHILSCNVGKETKVGQFGKKLPEYFSYEYFARYLLKVALIFINLGRFPGRTPQRFLHRRQLRIGYEYLRKILSIGVLMKTIEVLILIGAYFIFPNVIFSRYSISSFLSSYLRIGLFIDFLHTIILSELLILGCLLNVILSAQSLGCVSITDQRSKFVLIMFRLNFDVFLVFIRVSSLVSFLLRLIFIFAIPVPTSSDNMTTQPF